MCGRSSSARSGAGIRAATGAVRSVARAEYRSSWNVGPGNRAPVLRRVVPREEDSAVPEPEPAPADAEAYAAGDDSDDDVVAIDADGNTIDQPKLKKPKPTAKPPTAKGDEPTTKAPNTKKDDDDDTSRGGGSGSGKRAGGAVTSSSAAGASTAGSQTSTGSGSGSGSGSGTSKPVDTELVMDVMRWGLLPGYSKSDSPQAGQPLLINARSETVNQKAAFRRLVEKKRCIVPVDGFYEWEKKTDPSNPSKIKKTPYYIHLPDRDNLPTTKQLLTDSTPKSTAPAAAAAAAAATMVDHKSDSKSVTKSPTKPVASAAAAPTHIPASAAPSVIAASAQAEAVLSKPWTCAACTVSNAASRTVCGTCLTPNAARQAMVAMRKPVVTPIASSSSSSSSSASDSATAIPFTPASSDEDTDTLGDAVLTKRPLMFLAGLWDEWTNRDTGEVIRSYTVLTTDATKDSEWLHDRLPLILDEAGARVWLDTERYSFADCVKIIKPYNKALVFYAVSDQGVNFMRNKGIDVIEPLESVNAKKKANGIGKFFGAPAAAATSVPTKAGATPKGDPHSWPQAVDWWKQTEKQIAAWKKKHPTQPAAASSAAPASNSSNSPLGKRKAGSTAASPAKSFGGKSKC